MQKITIAATLAALLSTSGPVLAADPYGGFKDTPYTPAFTWTGFYAGVNAGIAITDSNWSNTVVPSDTAQNLPAVFSRHNVQGGFGGIQAGYNYQTVDKVVVGINSSMQFANMSGYDTCFGGYGDYHASCTNKIDWIADFTARFGYTPVEKLLIYVDGGIAYTSGSVQPANQAYGTSGPDGAAGYRSSDFGYWGYVFGAGFDYAIANNWLLGADYKYYEGVKKNVSFTPNAQENEVSPPFSADVFQSGIHSLSVKLEYKFDARYEPLK